MERQRSSSMDPATTDLGPSSLSASTCGQYLRARRHQDPLDQLGRSCSQAPRLRSFEGRGLESLLNINAGPWAASRDERSRSIPSSRSTRVYYLDAVPITDRRRVSDASHRREDVLVAARTEFAEWG